MSGSLISVQLTVAVKPHNKAVVNARRKEGRASRERYHTLVTTWSQAKNDCIISVELEVVVEQENETVLNEQCKEGRASRERCDIPFSR